MKIGERTGVTDPGRRRRQNEDAFVLEPPLFAVADGMGGAQAGELASSLATASFREFHEADDLGPEERLTAIIQNANRRIYERAASDRSSSGMGTTVTAALVTTDRIALGHVGDSRAYRIRGDELQQLTQDHSLVADLVRSGRLTPEEAGSHPQRSVITRALGTDPEVDVDAFTVDAAPGDVFLLCSDGLTSMVDDATILRTVRESKSLATAGKALVKAANSRGGEDNVTVVLFEVAAVAEAPLDDTLATNGNIEQADADLEDTLSGLELPPAVAEAQPTRVVPAPAEAEGAGWEAVVPPSDDEPKRAPRRRRLLLLAVAVLALLAAVLVLVFWGLGNAHFVGAEGDGRLAVYQGLPWDLGGGVSLYRARYVSELRAVQLTQGERAALFDHDLMSFERARSRVARYEAEGVP